MGKMILVEGRSDKQKIAPLINDEIVILCTNGTISEVDLIDLLAPYEHYEMVTMFDADRNGEKLRKLMTRTFSEAQHLLIPSQFKEVAETPTQVLLELFKAANLIKEG